MSIKIPEKWYFIDKNKREILAKKNLKSVISEDEDSKEYIDVATEKTALIFTIFKYPMDTIMEVNPNITITATNISETPDLKDIEHAIEQTKEGIKEVSDYFTFEDDKIETTINDKTFKGYKFSVTINQMTGYYQSYLANYEDYNLLITISYKNEADKKRLLQVLNNIKTVK